MDLGLGTKPRRKPSLTPMIDVVFLLLVFFMLASRFVMPQAIEMPMVSGGGVPSGPPKLVDILPQGVRLNGVEMPLETVVRDLHALVDSPQDVIVLRSQDQTSVQQVVRISDALKAAGFTALVLVE